MLDEEMNPSTRAELLRLTPSGDLLDLARRMRDMGVESLLFSAPSGRIRQVVTDRQIAHLAANPDPLTANGTAAGSADAPAAATPAPEGADSTIPRQGAPARAEEQAAALRT